MPICSVAMVAKGVSSGRWDTAMTAPSWRRSWRGLATRYEQRAVNYRVLAVIASITSWLSPGCFSQTIDRTEYYGSHQGILGRCRILRSPSEQGVPASMISHSCLGRSRGGSSRRSEGGGCGERQGEPEGGSLAGGALDPHLAAVALDDGPADREA